MTSNRAPDPMDIQVGKTIRAYRIVAGLSQTELAEKLGVTFQQVQKYEKGVNRVGAGRLSRIAKVLTIDIATLFGSTPAPAARAGDTGFNGLASDRNSLRLIRAFSEIDDRDVRQLLADLVEKIAGGKPNSRPREAKATVHSIERAAETRHGEGHRQQRQAE